MRYRLTSSDGTHSFELRDGAVLVVGRAPASDIPVIDPTISRRHAEVQYDGVAVHVRDLGSSNGTFVNGTRIDAATVSTGDLVTFGKVAFRLQQITPPVSTPAASPPLNVAGATIVRQLPVRDPTAAFGGLGSGAAAAAAAADPAQLQTLAAA